MPACSCRRPNPRIRCSRASRSSRPTSWAPASSRLKRSVGTRWHEVDAGHGHLHRADRTTRYAYWQSHAHARCNPRYVQHARVLADRGTQTRRLDRVIASLPSCCGAHRQPPSERAPDIAPVMPIGDGFGRLGIDLPRHKYHPIARSQAFATSSETVERSGRCRSIFERRRPGSLSPRERHANDRSHAEGTWRSTSTS